MHYRAPGADGQFPSRSPHQSHLHADSAVERHADTSEPSLQQAAVGILQSVDNQTVLAWLTALRYESGCEHWFQPRPPSSQQRDALSALKAYPDGLVLLWLDNARSGNSGGLQTAYAGNRHDARRSIASLTTDASQGSPNPTLKSSAGSFGPPSSNHEDCCPSRPRSAHSQRRPFPKASNETFNHQGASPSTKPGRHPHGCFLCETPRAIGTCDGWKRHMKEHETVFPCMQCEDSDTAGKPRSYTRKANLVKHLFDTHNISNSDASAQADTWRKTVKRKYFSCGFCVSLFYNIADQLNHIDTEHFRRLQDISGWNISKVIKGLIQQPGVNLFWQHFFGAGYPKSQDFTWNDSVAKNLQLRLELSAESAEDLATAAISQVIWTQIPQDSDEASVTGGFTNPHMEMDQNMLSVQDRATVTPAYSSSTTTNTSSGTKIAHEVSRGPSSTLEWEVSNNVDINSFYTQSTIPQIQTQLPYRSALPSYDQTDPGTQPIFQQSESSNSAQSYTAPPTPWDDSAPTSGQMYNGSTSVGSSSATDEGWPGNAFPVSSNSTSRTYTAASAYRSNSLAKGHGHQASRATIDQIAGLSPHPDRRHLSARAKKQLSQNKLRRHYGSEMDLDFDDVEHVMREEGHTRSEKHQR